VKIIVYATNNPEKNQIVDAEVVELLNKDAKISYVTAKNDPEKKDFEAFKDWYGKLGYKNIACFDLGKDYSLDVEEVALQGNVVCIDDDNPFNTLGMIIKRNLGGKLGEFVKKGGVLIGIGKGGMLIGRAIKNASLLMEDVENTYNVDGGKALEVTNFNLFPHYKDSEELDEKLLTNSKTTNIIALREGEGIIVWDDDKFIIGEPQLFFLGNKELLERF
jgi:peptidase E